MYINGKYYALYIFCNVMQYSLHTVCRIVYGNLNCGRSSFIVDSGPNSGAIRPCSIKSDSFGHSQTGSTNHDP